MALQGSGLSIYGTTPSQCGHKRWTPFFAMSWVSGAIDRVKHAFDLYFNRENNCHFLQIPQDVFVDDIFPYLLIDDLLQLRKTCTGMYLLTHHPIIWKRYMRRLQVHITQLRPTFKFAEKSSNYEIEFLVTRACALDRSWRRNFPRIEKRRVLTTQYKVIDLKFLPGGKFLVASAKDRCNFRFYILVYALDIMNGSRLLARLPTYFKVYDLQAHYMDHKGRPGIMISYTRRRFQHGAPINIDISDFGHRTPIDVISPLLYESFAVHLDLENIEAVIWPTLHPWLERNRYLDIARALPRPFCQVMRFESQTELHSPSLFFYNNTPFYGCVAGSNNIHIIELQTGKKATIEFKDYPGFERMPHRIRAWRFLPCQSSVLVFRSISCTQEVAEIHVVEFFKVPGSVGFFKVDAEYGYLCRQRMLLNGHVVIADPVDPCRKMGEDHPDPHPREECPPTLWAFASLDEPKGCAYWCFRPEPKDDWDPEPKFLYKCTELADQPRMHLNTRGHSERALPGSERTLLYEYDKALTDGQPIIKMRRFFWPEDRFLHQYPTKEVCYPVREEIPEENPTHFAFRDIHLTDMFSGKINNEGGLTAITWDETSGRVALTSENADDIYIWDLAPVLEPHHRLAYRWWFNLIEPETDTRSL